MGVGCVGCRQTLFTVSLYAAPQRRSTTSDEAVVTLPLSTQIGFTSRSWDGDSRSEAQQRRCL